VLAASRQTSPRRLVVRSIRCWPRGGRGDLDRQGNREVDTDDGGLALAEIGEKRGRRAVNLAACALDDLAVTVVRESMHYQGSNLAEDALGQIAWPLGRQADVQTVLPTFSGDQLEGVEADGAVLIPHGPAQKVVRLVNEY
jgi:hypothetical protein